MEKKAIIQVERMTIPTYPISDCERMPMFNENRMHQGTDGNPYPVMPVLSVTRENLAPRDYEVVRMENDYIRVILIPELGGRVFEAYDKVNHYDFLYRQHVIKPALIGAYGLWISGGLEFNWPFHHRPSTYMPVNFSTETQPDGTVITWLSECDPIDRMSSTIGIVLHPDAAFFETRIQVTNRTSLRHSFLMWQNAAVPVNEDYQFVFPPDVNYVNNHHSMARAPLTYPVAKGSYFSANYDEPTDISWYKNCIDSASHFAAPSKYDFFGGYDHGKKCGVIHIADHHVSPGKKMFTWGRGALGKSWEGALTDADGPYCELMAGSYSNNQPDFTWINPYETKCFSEFWYPVGAVGKTSFASLDAAVSVAKADGTLRVQTTRAQKGVHVLLKANGETVLDAACETQPGEPVALTFAPFEGYYSITLSDANGCELLAYQEEKLEELNVPDAITISPHPETLRSVQELCLEGVHTDQYRHPQIQPSAYYEEALRRDPDHVPSLVALGEYRYRNGCFKEAKKLLEKAISLSHMYNLHAPDEEAMYLLGLTLDAMGETDAAYNTFYQAAWSGVTAAKAMSHIAAIDGRRGHYEKMLAHAETSLEYAARNPIAAAYAALAENKLGKTNAAKARLEKALRYDPLSDMAAYAYTVVTGGSMDAFWADRRSDFSQIALDVAYDLLAAGCCAEAAALLESVKAPTSPMIGYTLAYAEAALGKDNGETLKKAAACEPHGFLPYRIAEIKTLEWVLAHNEDDAMACDMLAGVLYDKFHYEEAAALWEKATELVPEKALCKRNLAIAYFDHLHKKEAALDLLEQAMVLAPENDQLKLEYLYAAEKYGMEGEKRLAMIEKYPLKGEMPDDYALEYANAYLAAGRYAEAKALMLSHAFKPAEGGEMAINTVWFNIMLHLGREALADGRYEEAYGCFEEALVLPENLHSGLWTEASLAPIKYYKAVALDKMGKKAESLAVYQEILARMMPTPALAFYFASAMRALGMTIEARIFLGKMVRALDETISRPSIGWEDMISAFNPFVHDRQDQREGTYAYQRGMIKLYEGDVAGARALLEKSKKLWPDNMATWVELDFLK